MEDKCFDHIFEALKISWNSLCTMNENISKLNPAFKLTKNEMKDVSIFGEYTCPTFNSIFNSASSKGIPHSLLSETITNFISELNKYFVSKNIQFIAGENNWFINFKSPKQDQLSPAKLILPTSEIALIENQETYYKMIPIGYIESIYPDMFGVPRQAFYAPEAKGIITLRKGIDPRSLDEIEGLSHIWVIFLFDQYQLDKSSIPMKTMHPIWKKEIGFFATRSPVRLNPIGMSIFKLEKRISPNQLLIQCCDLISGTPILDIKPYILTDSVPNPKVFDFYYLEKQQSLSQVEFTENAQTDILNLIKNQLLRFYDNYDEALKLINSIFSHNPHIIGKKEKEEDGSYLMALDNMAIKYKSDEIFSKFVIMSVSYLNPNDPNRLISIGKRNTIPEKLVK